MPSSAWLLSTLVSVKSGHAIRATLDELIAELIKFPNFRLILVALFGRAGVLIALGLLVYWHSKLIYRGETSIEAHINASETKRLRSQDKIYRNPYDFNGKRNFEMFLGLTDGR